MPPEELLKAMFDAAVQAALPSHRVSAFLPEPPAGRTVVVGMGKATAAMAQAVEAHWPGQLPGQLSGPLSDSLSGPLSEPLSGLVVTRYGHGVPTQHIEVVEAGHPVPDDNGYRAAERILDLVSGLGPEDLVICLVSGGGSALFTLPPAGIDLATVAALNKQLLKSGAAIDQMNGVRKSLSRSSGGRLAAAAYPARVVSLVISDVPGDGLEAIASGPTVGDTITPQAALEILRSYNISIPTQVTAHLMSGNNPVIQPDDVRLSTTTHHLIATPQQSLIAAAQVAQAHGYTPLILSDALEGEARAVGRVQAGIAQQVRHHQQPMPPPCVLLSGGETTVTITGKGGNGGRNGEFLLSLMNSLAGTAGIYALAADTDGIDGVEDNAGALFSPELFAQAQQQQLSPQDFLDRHDSYTFFEALDALVMTGPTLTNVNDFRAILIQ
ncbi:MAG: glycerate kinase [Cyanobacteria bacterium P01_A01_bin.105]